MVGRSTELADESVVTSHGSPQIVPHGDATLKGIAPLSINRRGMGIGGLGREVNAHGCARKQLLSTNLTAH